MESSDQLSIVCIGSATQDVYLRNILDVKTYCKNPDECFYDVRLGDKIYVNDIDFTVGGGATNAATTFVRSGWRVAFMGMIGDDGPASQVVDSFKSDAVNTDLLIQSSKYHTDYSTILLAPNGERTILTYRGCGMNLQADDFDLSKTEYQFDWMYLTSLMGKFAIYDKITSQARERHINIAFNPGKIELESADEMRHILLSTDIVSVNKQEAQLIVSGDTLEELVRNLSELCPVAIVTDGVNGAIATDRKTIVRSGLYSDGDSIDRTGAGDAFFSGFVSRYARGSSLKEAMHFASANSSSVVTAIGAKTAILYGGAQLHDMDLVEYPY